MSSFNPINDKNPLSGAMPVDKVNDLPEFDLADIDFKEIEKKASIFVKDTKFVEVDETVKLVDVAKNGKIIYEDNNGMKLADSQLDLAETMTEDDNAIKGFLGGFFGKSKSMFNKNNGNFA